MRTKLSLCLILLINLLISSVSFAASNIPNSILVTEWAERVLMDSLTASYFDKTEDIKSVQKYYSLAAWETINDFFNNELKIINQYKLSVHPKALTKPMLSKETNCEYKLCWRVNQKFKLPELRMTIDFSLVITRIIQSNSEHYFIQNLNMNINRY